MSSVVVAAPDVQSGAPVFKDTRVPVQNFFDYLRGGDTIDEFLADFPSVSRVQILTLISEAQETLSRYAGEDTKA